jgi:hypothetical protein
MPATRRFGVGGNELGIGTRHRPSSVERPQLVPVCDDCRSHPRRWCLSNLTIGLSYLLLPVEIRRWHLALPFKSTALIGALFIGFIGLCGISHLAMIIIMPTGPWWATLLIYVPTGAVSLAAVMVVRRERQLIVAALEGVGAALAEGGE